MATGPKNGQPVSAKSLLEALEHIQAQNRVGLELQREVLEHAESTAKAARQTATHTFWIALPIWVGLALGTLWLGYLLLMLFDAATKR